MSSRSATRTFLVIALAVVAGVYVGTSSLGPPEIAASPSPSATGTQVPDALRVFAVGAIPAAFRFVLVGDAGDERSLLLDLGRGTVTLAAHFEGVGTATRERNVEIASVASGELFVILLRSEAADARVYLISPAKGEVRTIVIPKSEQPRLSPDGRALAVARTSDDAAQNGLWIVSTADGRQRRVVADAAGQRATRPLAWSSDGKWLAVTKDPDAPGQTVALVDAASGGLQTLGAGTGARWRDAELLFWDARRAGGVTAYDTITHGARPAYPAEAGVTTYRVEPRPGSSDTAVQESGPTGISQIVLHGTQRAAALLTPDASGVIGYWWSPDAAHLYVWSNDNGTTAVVDAMNKTTVVTFCLRQRIAPPCG